MTTTEQVEAPGGLEEAQERPQDPAVDGLTLEELRPLLADPEWRLTHLYWITDKDSRVVKFSPNRQQRRLYRRIHTRNIVLKARQQGFSTFIQILMLDVALFVPNSECGIVAQDDETAKQIFRTKIKFAFDRLPALVAPQMVRSTTDSVTQLILSNGSSIRVATSLRGGTLQMLHVSEFGKICARFPERAKEVLSGSIQSVPKNALVFIESTAEGAAGAFFDMCQRSMGLREQGRAPSPLEYAFHFSPWWGSPEYSLAPGTVPISPALHTYFAASEAKLRINLSMAQRTWYAAKLDNDFAGNHEVMKREYPRDPDEAFEVSTEGKYFTAEMAWLRQHNRITTVPHTMGLPVNTFWDIGSTDGTAIWLHQRVGLRDHFIGFLEGWDEPYDAYVERLQALRYAWGTHHLPHDAGHQRQGLHANVSPADMLAPLLRGRIEVVPRVLELQHGLQQCRRAFRTSWFDETECAAGIRHLALYGKTWSPKAGNWIDTPLKDGHTEAPDAYRQFAQGYSADPDLPEEVQQERREAQEDELYGRPGRDRARQARRNWRTS